MQWLDVFAVLVKDRIFAFFGVAVVHLHRGFKAAGRQFEFALEFREGFSDRRNLVHIGGLFKNFVVDDQPGPPIVVQQCLFPEATVVGVFGHKALALGVDHDTALESPRLGDGHGDRNGAHVQCCSPSTHAEVDPAAIVSFGCDAHFAPLGERSMVFEHFVVQDEPASGDDDAFVRADVSLFAESCDDGANHFAVGLLVERGTARVHHFGCRASFDFFAQHLHQKRSALMLDLRHVSARRGGGDFAIGVDLLGPGPDESVVGGRFAANAVVVGLFERDTVAGEPVVLIDAAVAVKANLGFVGVFAARGHQELEHFIRGVFETARLLEGRSSAHIDHAPAHCRCSPAAAASLDDHGGEAERGRVECRGCSGDPHPDNEDVDFVVPMTNGLRGTVQRGHWGVSGVVP